jgi:hypothetical protein
MEEQRKRCKMTFHVFQGCIRRERPFGVAPRATVGFSARSRVLSHRIGTGSGKQRQVIALMLKVSRRASKRGMSWHWRAALEVEHLSSLFHLIHPGLVLSCISAFLQGNMASGTVTIDKAYFETLLRR